MINILYLHAGAELYGADVILLELLKRLDKKTFKPYVILPGSGPLVEELKALGIEVEVYNYPILRRQFFNPLGLINYIKDYIKSYMYLKKFCTDKKIRIIHSNTAAVLEGAALKHSLKVKHLWHLHEMLERPKVLYKALAFIISRSCDNVIAVSDSVKGHWLKSKRFKEDSIKVVHNGIDTEKFNPCNETDYLRKELGIKVDELVVGMIGRVNAIKGQAVFIEAMERVFAVKKDVKAVLVGGCFEGQEWRYKELEERVKNSAYSSNFILQDFRRDVANFHCLFDIYALPSIENDSFPTVVLEAMASGKPVVGFKSGGIVEMIEDGQNGYFADFGDSSSLADKILSLLEDDRRRKAMSQYALEKQRKCFSVDSFITGIQKIYEES